MQNEGVGMGAPSVHPVVRSIQALERALGLGTFGGAGDDDKTFVRTQSETAIRQCSGQNAFCHRRHVKCDEFQTVSALSGIIDGITMLTPFEVAVLPCINRTAGLEVGEGGVPDVFAAFQNIEIMRNGITP